MSFCRNPFQFTSTDLAERHSELMKRFGVSPTTSDSMHLETSNSDQACDQFSPRLQHRIPVCLADGLEMASSGNNAESVDSGQQKPKVRIIPIQIEGAASRGSERQRTQSGGNVQNSLLVSEDKVKSNSTCSLPVSAKRLCDTQGKHIPVQHEANQLNDASPKPKIIDIPVFVEGRDIKKEEPLKMRNIDIPIHKVGSQVTTNVPTSKPVSNNTVDMSHPLKNKVKVSSYIISMDKISAVLKELDLYKESVINFSGVQGDKEYRYLDEMLTRCMLKLDDVETHENEDIRKARKAAVKEVEKYVCMLDSKIKVTSSDEIANSESGVIEAVNNDSGLVDQRENIGELPDSVQKMEETDKDKMDTDIQETVVEIVTSTIKGMKEGEDECIESKTECEGVNQNSSALACVETVDSVVKNCVEQKSEDKTAIHVNLEEKMLLSDNESANIENCIDCNAVVKEKVEVGAKSQENNCNGIQEKMEVETIPVKNMEKQNGDKLEIVSEK